MIYVLRYFLILLITIFWGTVACVFGMLDRSGEALVWVGRRYCRWILWSCRVRARGSGLEHLDPEQPYIFMSNHQSAFDIPAIVDTLPRSYRFVAKKELTRIPFFGWALIVSGNIIVDRQNREKAVRSLERAGEHIRNGANVIVFPEGTRSPAGDLHEFKSGGFHLAISAGVPIIPVSVSGTNRITPKGSLRVESGDVRVHYGSPIPTAHLTVDDRHLLKQQVRDGILRGFDPSLQGITVPASTHS